MGAPWWTVPQGAIYEMNGTTLTWTEHITGIQTGFGVGDIDWALTAQ